MKTQKHEVESFFSIHRLASRQLATRDWTPQCKYFLPRQQVVELHRPPSRDWHVTFMLARFTLFDVLWHWFQSEHFLSQARERSRIEKKGTKHLIKGRKKACTRYVICKDTNTQKRTHEKNLSWHAAAPIPKGAPTKSSVRGKNWPPALNLYFGKV